MAPQVFTKMLALLVSLIHQQGVQFIPYLDDYLQIGQSAKSVTRQVQLAVSVLQRVGFIINWEKSSLIPSQTIQFLGMIIESKDGMVRLPEQRAQDMIECTEVFSAPNYRSAHTFLRFLGLMAAC